MRRLMVRGNKIVNSTGEEIRLRGTCIGGWLNMENFISGFAGTEHGMRKALADVLGARMAEFFMDRFIEHFFGEDDVAFIKRCGFTVIRVPFNYRHFEDDARPFEYKEKGFEKIDRLLDICEKHELYVILDMHAAPGYQNTHWHSDNDLRHSFLWDVPYYQERFTALWRQFAKRYRDRNVVAGYNLLNEPCSNTSEGDYPYSYPGNYRPDWEKINGLYRKAVEAIREIDADHIIFLEGDCYSRLFSGLEKPFDGNLAYSSHNYNAAGFGPGPYPGMIRTGLYREGLKQYWDREIQAKTFAEHEGTIFCKKHDVPLWIGEFGSVYNGDPGEVPNRLRAMDDQVGVFEEYGAHWTTWTYKDVGVMGMVTLDPESGYMKLVSPFIGKKARLFADDWMKWMPATESTEAIKGLSRYIVDVLADPGISYEANCACLAQATLSVYVSALMQPAYAGIFKGMSGERLDEVLESFAFKNCKINRELVDILGKYAAGTRA